MEIRLNENSLIRFEQTYKGMLYLEMLWSGNLRDEHGPILKGSALLADDKIDALLALLQAQW
jgi:hypothetical protein